MENNNIFILLAGGKSSRMGSNKGLLNFKEKYWILEQLNRISSSNITEVYIGLGYNFNEYFNAIPWLKKAQHQFVNYKNLLVKATINNQPELGSFSTLQSVLRKVSSNSYVIICPIDIPILNSFELNKIISKNDEIVYPNFNGKNGHPIKISPTIWTDFLKLNPRNLYTRLDFQLKKINPNKISTVEVFDRAIIYNLNKKTDWNSYLDSMK